MYTFPDENAILGVSIDQLLKDGVFDTEDGSLPVQTIEVEDTLSSERNEIRLTINEPAMNQASSTLVQRDIFDEDQEIETGGDEIINPPQSNCCKAHQKVLNKIDYVQKKLSKEMSVLRQETRSNRQLLLRVLNLLSPTEVQAEDVRDDQMEEPAQLQIDMAELDRFNAKYKEIFPISSSDSIVDFNKSLKDDQPFADYLFAKLSQIKGADEIKTVRKILKELCSVPCLKDFTWLGTKKMKCFQDLHLIIEMISKLLKDKYPECDAINIIAKVVKQRTKSAKEAAVAKNDAVGVCSMS